MRAKNAERMNMLNKESFLPGIHATVWARTGWIVKIRAKRNERPAL